MAHVLKVDTAFIIGSIHWLVMQSESLCCSLSSWRKVTNSVSLKSLSCPGSSSSSFSPLPLFSSWLAEGKQLCSALSSPPQTTLLPYHSPTTMGSEQTCTSWVLTPIALSSFNYVSQIFATATKFQRIHGGGDVRTWCLMKMSGIHSYSVVVKTPCPDPQRHSFVNHCGCPSSSAFWNSLSSWLAVYLSLCFVCCLTLFFSQLFYRMGKKTDSRLWEVLNNMPRMWSQEGLCFFFLFVS